MSDDVGEHGTVNPEANKTLTTLDTLRYIVEGARELPGRKVVILLSEGFRLDTEDRLWTDPRVW